MRFFQFILIAITILCLINCKRNNENNSALPTEHASTSKVLKVILARGGCEGNCPIENIQINSDLDIILFAQNNYKGDSSGFYIGKVDAAKWDSIAQLINVIDFNQYKNHYFTGQDDELFSIRVEIPKANTIISGNESNLPKPILDLIMQIINAYTSAELKRTPLDSSYIKSNAFLVK